MKRLFFSVLGIATCIFFAACFLADVTNTDVNEQLDKLGVTESNIKTDTIGDTSGGGGNETNTNVVVKDRSQETRSYYDEIVFNTEFGGRRETAYKWKTDLKIYIDGEKPDYLVQELKDIVSELNGIINPIELKIVSTKSEANYFVYFGDHQDFKAKYDLLFPSRLDHNMGYFEVYYDSGNMYVDLYRTTDKEAHKHLLREELTQSLGLLNDSYDYPESIFYQGWTTTTEYAPIDVELIDMLYNE